MKGFRFHNSNRNDNADTDRVRLRGVKVITSHHYLPSENRAGFNIEKDAYYDYEGTDYETYSYAYTYPPECACSTHSIISKVYMQ